MKLSIRIFSFSVLIGLGGVLSAGASNIRCETIFQPTVQNVLEKIDSENSQFLLRGKSFDEYTQSLSWLRKRKAMKLVRDLDIGSFPSDKALERYAIELGTTLFGQKEIVDRWLFKSKDQRLEESTVLIIKEQLLKEGLLKTWGDVYNPAKNSLLKRLLDRVWILLNSRIGDLVRFPFHLPPAKNKEISTELMYKIIRDGFNPHAEEIRVALKQQNNIEAYNTFRKLYAPIFYSALLVVQVEYAYHQRQLAVDQQVQQTVLTLSELRERLDRDIPAFKQEEFQKAYKDSEAEFKEKWGEAPTPEESAQLKAKIEKSLNMH